MLRERRRKNEALIDALARRYGQRPCDVVGMQGADPMKRLVFDFSCASAGASPEGVDVGLDGES
jgi:hypothetical protein